VWRTGHWTRAAILPRQRSATTFAPILFQSSHRYNWSPPNQEPENKTRASSPTAYKRYREQRYEYVPRQLRIRVTAHD
jgi:hypothetical protein